jgi:cobaltochelatase CobS
VQLVAPGGETKEVDGPVHPNFPLLLRMAQARDTDGHHVNIFLSGEASSGKTTACKQLAKALDRKWYFNGAISMPHEMLGFIDAAGNYHRTPFRDAYEHGGVYTFDEVDRSDPVALLAVNPHLANGVATFPDGQIKRHKDCLIICTANTWGNGANADYCGATKLDAAFLSRFPARLSWNIDKAFETSIAGNEAWAQRVQGARSRAQAAGLKVMIDVRMTLAGAALIASGLSEQEAAEATYLANVTPDQRSMIEAG